MTIRDAIDRLEVLCVLDAPSLRTAVDMAKDALREADKLGGLDRLRQMVQAEQEGSLLIIGLGIKEAVYTPPADSAPVVHARWVPECHRDRVLLYHCSRCGRKLLRFRDPREATYCFCGARMDLREDDDE